MPDVSVNGVRLNYEVHGSGEPVLFVCGTGQPAFSWSLGYVPAITEAGYRAVVFDNRGMPPSDSPDPPYTVGAMVEDTAGLVVELGMAPCRVIGYSLGAFIAQELSLARPDLVRGAVLMGTFGRKDVFRRALMNAWVELDQAGIELPKFYDTVASCFSLFSPRSLDKDDAMSLYLKSNADLPVWTGAGKLGQHLADADYDDRLEALTSVAVRCLVIAFELDMVTPAHLGKEVADAIPECRYTVFDGCGHAGAFEKPDEVIGSILGFFDEL